MITADRQRLEQWVRPEIRRLTAYHVPDVGELIKLDAMENPYRWPAELIEQWLERLRDAGLNRYPDAAAREVKARLRKTMAIPGGAEILLGNGSDELIQMLLLAVAVPGRKVLAPDPSFSMYRMIASFVGMDFIGVPLRPDFSLDLRAMLTALEQFRPAVVFICYPNNPTGNLFDQNDIVAIIERAEGLVVIDEAYHAFCDETFMQRLAGYDHVLLLRTVSKMGLAGLRLGLLAGAPSWLGEIDKIRLPYNINILTQLSAEFALDHQPVLDEQTAAIRRDREHMRLALQRLPAIEVFPSQTNFLLFRVTRGRAAAIFDGLKQRGVLIKNVSAPGLLEDCLRVTIGRPAENECFLNALSELVR